MLGALYTAAGVGGLVGPPLIGAVIDGVSYDAGIVLAMAISAVATGRCCSCCPPATTAAERAPSWDLSFSSGPIGPGRKDRTSHDRHGAELLTRG